MKSYNGGDAAREYRGENLRPLSFIVLNRRTCVTTQINQTTTNKINSLFDYSTTYNIHGINTLCSWIFDIAKREVVF